MSTKPLIGVILTLFLGASSLAATPQEKKQDIITRTANGELSVRTELSLNVMRSEPYQDTYTERVPYQAEETYYVDVPYQTTETYYENVPYYEQETYWENVPYTERVPYTDYEEYYDNEYVCRNVTRYREECSSERVCEPGRNICRNVEECGTNAHGQRICKTRKVCEDGPRECRDIRQCRQVPYSDRECGYERVRKTRPVTRYREETHYRPEQRTRTVTKYRQEQRTRTVTKYRKEERTRTVTRYREETRCCVTRYKDVFDHQFTQPASVIFPVGSELLANETESVKFVFSGTESAPDVTVSVTSDVFAYTVAETRQEGREKVFVLAVTPKWTVENAGTTTIQGFKLAFSKGEGKISFVETVAGARLQTTYLVEIRDEQSQALVFASRIENTQAKVVEIATPGLAREGKYTLSLQVERRGQNVTGGVIQFAQTALYEKKGLAEEEISLLSDSKQVVITGMEGAGAERVVTVRDNTPHVDEVQSTYKLVVWKKLSNGKIEWLGEKNFPREAIQRLDGNLGIALKDIGLNPSSSIKLYMDLVVRRESAQHLPTRVQFIVNKTF
ncbi:MAG: hypothetical protein OM95_11675 [Bdellovibrio sp. ArHS]|uniref:hypothetical protein n=1 Tax=Bdellovibrio sp. ArHS TaxID=1569284 RepID=UPI00058293CA|nr:hypothetical protein [Bdellovibrio sp. ArHS]KHD87925.1 MAG: hypothetical protein OM95_11675 [Bdellovibrio sp. ArHS]